LGESRNLPDAIFERFALRLDIFFSLAPRLALHSIIFFVLVMLLAIRRSYLQFPVEIVSFDAERQIYVVDVTLVVMRFVGDVNQS
jgi:hypothetical protein